MASESGTFNHVAEVHKWSEQQTTEAARYHGVDPDELTQDHFTSLGWEPEEHLLVDHTANTVIHNVRGGGGTYTIEEWNQKIAEEQG